MQALPRQMRSLFEIEKYVFTTCSLIESCLLNHWYSEVCGIDTEMQLITHTKVPRAQIQSQRRIDMSLNEQRYIHTQPIQGFQILLKHK